MIPRDQMDGMKMYESYRKIREFMNH